MEKRPPYTLEPSSLPNSATTNSTSSATPTASGNGKPSTNSIDPPVTIKTSSWKDRFTWPRLWEYTLVFILGVCALFIVQSAWRVIRPPEPLAVTIGSIDLNSADVATLKQLPGVGPHLAARIVDYREKHGPFQNVDAIRSVSGIGPVALQRLRPFLFVTKPEPNGSIANAISSEPKAKTSSPTQTSTLKKSPDQLIDLNTATKEQLTSIPGVGPALAERILEDRQTHGPYQSINDLTRIKGVKAKTVEKLSPYIKVEAKEKPG